MSTTITDIARLAQVSKAAVSAALNNKPGISGETREKILAIVKEVNYRPSQVARSLSWQKTRTIGLLIKEIDNPYFSKIMKGVFDACNRLGYTVLLGSSELDVQKERDSIEVLRSQRVDGLILAPIQQDDTDLFYLTQLIQEKFPLITLGSVPNFQTSIVEIDNVKAAVQAVDYLVQQGHARIAYIAGPDHSGHNRERLNGYQQAMEKHRLSRLVQVVPAGSFIEDGFRAGKSMIPMTSDQPTAVLCYNDLVAFGFINAVMESGFHVPRDMSVVGFDDIPFCSCFKVPLTTVHIPAHQMGEKAAELLIRQIESEEMLNKDRIVLDASLIIRESVSENMASIGAS